MDTGLKISQISSSSCTREAARCTRPKLVQYLGKKNEAAYYVAAVLDPRIKLVGFDGLTNAPSFKDRAKVLLEKVIDEAGGSYMERLERKHMKLTVSLFQATLSILNVNSVTGDSLCSTPRGSMKPETFVGLILLIVTVILFDH